MALHIKVTIFSVLVAFFLSQCKQNEITWNGKKCAIVLSYDDALNIHLDQVVPALDSFGLKGTFYINGDVDGFKKRTADWKNASIEGHELGNHTFTHPCIGGTGREWVSEDKDLNKFTREQIEFEIVHNNKVLKEVDGKDQRTFAYPCGDQTAGGDSYVDIVKANFIAARGVSTSMPTLQDVNLYDIDSYVIVGQSGSELKKLVDKAIENKRLLVFLFHGVGGEHDMNVSLEAHRELLQHIQKNESQIWNAPMVEVASYIQAHQ